MCAEGEGDIIHSMHFSAQRVSAKVLSALLPLDYFFPTLILIFIVVAIRRVRSA